MTWDEQNQKEVEAHWDDLERAQEQISELETLKAAADEGLHGPLEVYADESETKRMLGAIRNYTSALEQRIARLEADNADLRMMKIAAERTPKQWSTAQAPTMEALVNTINGLWAEQELAAVKAERDELRARHQSAQRVWLARSGPDDPLPCVIPPELVEHVRKKDRERTAVEVYLVPVEELQEAK